MGDELDNNDNQDDNQNNDDQGNNADQGDKKSMIDMADIAGDQKDNPEQKGDDADKDQDKDKDQEQKAERPEHIPEKFWDPEKGEVRSESMMKAYNDLEKKLGNNKKAPENYEIELSEDLEKIFNKDAVDDDPMLNWFKEYAKENNFSQDMFNQALEGYAKSAGDFLAGQAPTAPDRAEEVEKLGKNAEAIIQNQVDFLGGMFKRGEINEAQAQEMLILTETAEGIQALQAIRNHFGDQQKIPLDLSSSGGVKSSNELMTMQADPRYGADAEYTAQVDAAYEKKYGTGNSGESQKSALS